MTAASLIKTHPSSINLGHQDQLPCTTPPGVLTPYTPVTCRWPPTWTCLMEYNNSMEDVYQVHANVRYLDLFQMVRLY